MSQWRHKATMAMVVALYLEHIILAASVFMSEISVRGL